MFLLRRILNYAKSVHLHYDYYKKECRFFENGNPDGPELPLIVNTPGWVKGYVQKESHLIRDRRLMAYFRQCLSSEMNIDTIREQANALVSHSPHQISMSSIHFEHLHCQIPSTEVLYSANASIVDLAVSSKEDNCLPICAGLGIHLVLNSQVICWLVVFVILLIWYLER